MTASVTEQPLVTEEIRPEIKKNAQNVLARQIAKYIVDHAIASVTKDA